MIRRAARLLLAIGCATSLAACITLFPKEKPAQLYRFGDHVTAQAGAGPGFAVRSAGFEFDRAAAGDAILTVSGDQVAYIGGARWAVAAPLLFEAAVRRGFDAPGGAVRLISAGEAGQAKFVMRLNVNRFEARYDAGPNAAPTIEVGLRAVLTRTADQSLVGAQLFEVKAPASDNSASAIAAAFDHATDDVVGQLVSWVAQTGASAQAAQASTP